MSTLAATRPVGAKVELQAPGFAAAESEQEDRECLPPQYEVLTYPADFILEELVPKLRQGRIRIPKFQRRFVWTQSQASRLIESFLRGLPVPAIYLFMDMDGMLDVIDGQQRLLSIASFFGGTFGFIEPGNGPKFALRGLDPASPYDGKTYHGLELDDPHAFHTLNEAVLRAFIVRQMSPDDTTSAYYIFERLNTGGTQLVGQEIRSCIYAGPFSDLLGVLNQEPDWREVFGKDEPDQRQRDVELVLRFLALHESADGYRKPMKDFLSTFMRRHRDDSADQLDVVANTFRDTVHAVREGLGSRPFHISAGLNAAVLDAVMTAFAGHLDDIPDDIRERYDTLIADEEFLKRARVGTTDEAAVEGRLRLAEETLFG